MEFWILLFVAIGAFALTVGAFMGIIYFFVWLIEAIQFQNLKRRTRQYNRGERQ